MGRRGFTLVELMLAAVLTVVVVGTVTLLYGYTFSGISNAATTFATNDQAAHALDTISSTVAQSVSCATVNSGSQTALKCLTPAAGSDTNGDGYAEDFQPSTTSRRGVERYAPGNRVWFYFSDSTGAFGSAGTTLWRAQRPDDETPTALDADAYWTFYRGSARPRHGLISSLSFVVDATRKTVTITISSSSLLHTERLPASTTAPSQTVTTTLSRTVAWRNFLQ